MPIMETDSRAQVNSPHLIARIFPTGGEEGTDAHLRIEGEQGLIEILENGLGETFLLQVRIEVHQLAAYGDTQGNIQDPTAAADCGQCKDNERQHVVQAGSQLSTHGAIL